MVSQYVNPDKDLMLYQEKSGLGHPGHKGGLMIDALRQVPHKLPPSQALGQPCPPLCGTLELSGAAGSPAMAEVSLASAEMMSLCPSQKVGGMFLTFGCSQQEKSNCPNTHHLQEIQTLSFTKHDQSNEQRLRNSRLFALPPHFTALGRLILLDVPDLSSPWIKCLGHFLILEPYHWDTASKKEQVMIEHAVCT